MDQQGKQTWRFRALDTWFFRESRPMESIGGSELLSAFPPSPRTMAGAIRTAVGNKHEVVDWKQWKAKDESGQTEAYLSLQQRLGGAHDFGQLNFCGPWLTVQRETGEIERLYPVPRNILRRHSKMNDQAIEHVARMSVGSPRYCDLGEKARLPVLVEQDRGWRYAEDYWLPAHALQAVLAGGLCKAEDFVATSALFEREARLGIARNNQSRAVEEGLLYQTRHVRPKPSVFIETDVCGLLPADYDQQGVIRLGGEGRGAAYSVHNAVKETLPAMPLWGEQAGRGIILVLLTPALLNPGTAEGTTETTGSTPAPLPGFRKDTLDGTTVWTGELAGIGLTLHCALQGKPVREGGWDLVNNCPRPVQSFAPAGSVYYLTVDNGNIEKAAKTLHLTQLSASGNDFALGRGLVAVGLWPAEEWIA